MGTSRLRRLPSASHRRAPLREDWDDIRAASHMIENFGVRASAVADQRAGNAISGEAASRWRRLAEIVRYIEAERVEMRGILGKS